MKLRQQMLYQSDDNSNSGTPVEPTPVEPEQPEPTPVENPTVDLSKYVPVDEVQARIDAAIQERLPRKEQSVMKTVFETLGVDNLDTAKEKLNIGLEAETRIQALQQELDTLKTERLNESRNTVLEEKLQGLGAVDLDKALKAAKIDGIDLYSAWDENNELDAEALKVSLNKLVENNSFLFNPQGTTSNRNNRPVQNKEVQEKIEKEIARKWQF